MSDENLSVLMWWVLNAKTPRNVKTLKIPLYFKYDYNIDSGNEIISLKRKGYAYVDSSGDVFLTKKGESVLEKNKAYVWGHRNKKLLLDYVVRGNDGMYEKTDLMKFQYDFSKSKYEDIDDFFWNELLKREKKMLRMQKMNELSLTYSAMAHFANKTLKYNEYMMICLLCRLFLRFNNVRSDPFTKKGIIQEDAPAHFNLAIPEKTMVRKFLKNNDFQDVLYDERLIVIQELIPFRLISDSDFRKFFTTIEL